MALRFRSYTLCLMLTFLLIFSACSPTPSVVSLGNSNGNLNNSGLLAVADGWFYFLNVQDEGKIYRFKEDGSSVEKFSDAKGVFLNTMNDSLYYVSGDDQFIHRLVLNDKSDEVVLDQAVTRIMVTDKLIYYLKDDKLYSMGLSDKKETALSEQAVMSFNLVGETVYFINDKQQLFKRTDQEAQISDKMITSFDVHKDNVYFTESTDQFLYTMNSEGQAVQALTQLPVSAFNVTEEWIYYSIVENEVPKLMKMKLDGTAGEVITESNAMLLCASGDWLHYLSFDPNTFEFKSVIMKTDGTQVSEYPMAMTEGSAPTEISTANMNEPIEMTDYTLTVLSAYKTNFIKGSDSVIFDDVTDNMYVFVNAEIENKTDSDLGHLNDSLSFMTDIVNLENRANYFPLIKEHTGDVYTKDGFTDDFYLDANGKKTIQLYVELDRNSHQVFLALAEYRQNEPLQAVELQGDVYYVMSFEGAYRMMQEAFPADKVEQGGGLGYTLENETEEKMFYSFVVTKSGQNMPSYYLVERKSGIIYEGKMDSKYPDNPIPVKEYKP